MATVQLTLFPTVEYEYTTQLDGLTWEMRFLYQPRLGHFTFDITAPNGVVVVTGRALTPNSYHNLAAIGGPPGLFLVDAPSSSSIYTLSDVESKRVRLLYVEGLPPVGGA
jgi:hypothetical protein